MRWGWNAYIYIYSWNNIVPWNLIGVKGGEEKHVKIKFRESNRSLRNLFSRRANRPLLLPVPHENGLLMTGEWGDVRWRGGGGGCPGTRMPSSRGVRVHDGFHAYTRSAGGRPGGRAFGCCQRRLRRMWKRGRVPAGTGVDFWKATPKTSSNGISGFYNSLPPYNNITYV